MVSCDQYQLINAKDWKIEESWYLTHGILLFVKKEGIKNDQYKSGPKVACLDQLEVLKATAHNL